jgi:hypothetical protein
VGYRLPALVGTAVHDAGKRTFAGASGSAKNHRRRIMRREIRGEVK